jgi:hypothetical protein
MVKLRPSKRDDDNLIDDPVMDEQIFRFLASFTQIQEENLRDRLIRVTSGCVATPSRRARF